MKYKVYCSTVSTQTATVVENKHDTLRVQIEKKNGFPLGVFMHCASEWNHENEIKKLEISLSNILYKLNPMALSSI